MYPECMMNKCAETVGKTILRLVHHTSIIQKNVFDTLVEYQIKGKKNESFNPKSFSSQRSTHTFFRFSYNKSANLSFKHAEPIKMLSTLTYYATPLLTPLSRRDLLSKFT